MATQVIDHRSRNYSPTLNFPSTENNLSWSFIDEGDGEIYSISTTNVATLSIAGTTVTLPFVTPIPVVNGTSYSVAITKTTNGQPASVTIRTRRAADKTVSISVPDFANLTVGSNYILLTNVGTNGQVVVTQKSALTPSNYLGGGAWTDSIIRATVNLPDIATPYGAPAFQWVNLTHAFFGGVDYVLAIGHAVASNTNRGRAVCLINPSTLAVTNLDGALNSYTYINATSGVADATSQTTPTYISENFINNKILTTPGLQELDINARTWSLNAYGFNSFDVGVSLQTKRQSYFNPIDTMHIGYYTMFNYNIGEVYTQKVCKGAYDYLRNSKVGTVSYWGRIQYYNKNGAITGGIENSTSYNIATIIKPKKDLLFLMSNTRIGYIKQTTPFTLVDNAIANSNFTTVNDACYAHENGDVWLYITNTSRLGVAFIDRVNNTVTQAYYDLTAIPTAMCNDKILISA